MTDLSGKVAIVTGASSGIGEAVALLMAQSGAKVVVAARRQAEGESVVQKIKDNGREAIFVKTDVAKLADHEALVAATLETYGRLDTVFNNAGVNGMGPLHEQTEEDWDYQMDINLKGSFFALKTQIPALLKSGGGSIVLNASISGEIGNAALSIYSASKGGVIALARAAAIEYAAQGIRINTVNAGLIWTPMTEGAFGSLETAGEFSAGKIPMGRLGQPEEIARAVVFLASDDASYMTGQSLTVDGGYTAQ